MASGCSLTSLLRDQQLQKEEAPHPAALPPHSADARCQGLEQHGNTTTISRPTPRSRPRWVPRRSPCWRRNWATARAGL